MPKPREPRTSDSWEQEQHRREEQRKRLEEKFRLAWQRARDERDARRHLTPWLLIRYSPTDLGARPIPSDDVFWQSPDIWLETSDPTGNPVAGQNNFPHVRVLNLGAADAAPVKVDFYWANPALGLGPANMNLIGTEWVEVDSLSAKDVRCNTPWVPILVNNGHECLMVNCSNHVADPVLQPFQPTLDRHVGQRNVHIIEGKASMIVPFTLEVNNVFPIANHAMVSARIEHLALIHPGRTLDERDILEQVIEYGAPETNTASELRRRYRTHTQEHRSALRIAQHASVRRKVESKVVYGVLENPSFQRSCASIASRLDDHSSILAPANQAQFMGNLLLARGKMMRDAGQEPQLVLREVELKPFEQRRLILEFGVPANARNGEYIAFHLMQWSVGFSLGGYTVVVKVVGKE
jgi:hypothetical protein